MSQALIEASFCITGGQWSPRASEPGQEFQVRVDEMFLKPLPVLSTQSKGLSRCSESSAMAGRTWT